MRYRVKLEDGFTRATLEYDDIREVVDFIRASVDNLRGENPCIVIYPVKEPVNEENPD